MRGIGDHPDIAAALRTGYPEGKGESGWKCPVCGEELGPDDSVYMNWREVIGCCFCVEVKGAQEVWEDE